jgi:hypothetical protein
VALAMPRGTEVKDGSVSHPLLPADVFGCAASSPSRHRSQVPLSFRLLWSLLPTSGVPKFVDSNPSDPECCLLHRWALACLTLGTSDALTAVVGAVSAAPSLFLARVWVARAAVWSCSEMQDPPWH